MAANADAEGEAATLVEGRDYTVEAGRWIFTAYYLRSRGYCCENGCRNCPYGFPDGKESGLTNRAEN